MSSVKSLLRKLINEEIDKLDEQVGREAGEAAAREFMAPPQAAPKCPKGMVPGPNKSSKNPMGCYWPEKEAIGQSQAKCVKRCPPGSAPQQSNEYPGGSCMKNNTVVAVLAAKGNERACKAMGGEGASPGPRKKNVRVVRFQKLLNKLSSRSAYRGLKPTRRAKDGADGAFGNDTLKVAKMHFAPYKEVAPYLKDVRTARRNTRKLTKFAQNLMKKAPQKKAAPAPAPKGARQPPAGADPSTAAAWPD
tara:strand:+ start:1033 stop:1776 length:744 start_codon:yes stop_codon:yes gene_type:complete